MNSAKPPLTDTHAPGAPAELGADRAEDLALERGDPSDARPRRLPVNAARGVAIAPQRVRGRPKGSANLRDTEVAEDLIGRYGDPLEADVAIGSMELGDLVTLLRCIASDRGLKLGATVMDIARFQSECRRQAMPFLHSKRATIDPGTGKPVLPVIGIGRVGTLNIGGGGRSIEDIVDAEIIEGNQEVSETDGGKSHGE